MHCPVVVLGGGPGGYAAAFLAADEGLEVTIVEADPRLGGTCLLRGCIPSKALLHVAKVIGEVDELAHEWGVQYGDRPKVDVDKLRARKDQVISNLTGGLAGLAKRRGVKVIRARGSFLSSNSLKLDPVDTGAESGILEGGVLTFDYCVIATGSGPAIPPGFDVGSDRVMDSTGALAMKDIPGTLLVIGGGYIGLELGSVYARLGSKVSVVELSEGLLPGADRDLVKPLAKRIEALFEGRIYLNTKVGSLAEVDNQVEVTFEGPGRYDHARYDRVLVSVGRRPVTRGLGLENTKVVVNQRGFVEVDRQQRTADPHIFAIGDPGGRLYRPRDRVGRLNGRAGEARRSQRRRRSLSVGGERQGAGFGPHRRVDQMACRSRDESCFGLRDCRVWGWRIDRRSGAGDRDGV